MLIGLLHTVSQPGYAGLLYLGTIRPNEWSEETVMNRSRLYCPRIGFLVPHMVCMSHGQCVPERCVSTPTPTYGRRQESSSDLFCTLMLC
jgi:hypothetical protein